MTQWKLVPVEPTREMIEAAFGAINYTMPEPSEDAGRVYAAMLSAAPSPVSGEDEVADRLQRKQLAETLQLAAIKWCKRPLSNELPYWQALAAAAISAYLAHLAKDEGVVERVARALCAMAHPPESLIDPADHSEFVRSEAIGYRDEARAALRSLTGKE